MKLMEADAPCRAAVGDSVNPMLGQLRRKILATRLHPPQARSDNQKWNRSGTARFFGH